MPTGEKPLKKRFHIDHTAKNRLDGGNRAKSKEKNMKKLYLGATIIIHS